MKYLGLGFCFCIDTLVLVLVFPLFLVWIAFKALSLLLLFGGLTAGAIWKVLKPILQKNNFHVLKTEIVQLSSEAADEDQPQGGFKVGRFEENMVVVTAIAEKDDYFSAKNDAYGAGLRFSGVKFAPYGLTMKFFYTFFVVERK